jgi:hypothetical protein
VDTTNDSATDTIGKQMRSDSTIPISCL